MIRSESWCDIDTSRYRLDLQLGIPQSRLQGTLEWWMGDPGLCRDPDRHPYLVLAEIAAREWGSMQEVMQAVAQSTEASGPILVSVSPAPGEPYMQEISSYQIVPSPGLRSFVLLLSRICPVIASPGSLADDITRGTQASFSTVRSLLPGDSTLSPCRNTEMRKTSSNTTKCPTATLQSLKNRNNEPVLIDILRIILRREEYPVAVYDLSQKKWLHPSESVMRKNARLSLRSFRIGKGYQITRSMYREAPQIYVISDLHLGHANGIPRYKRPFLLSDPGEMDRVLIRNWNWTVKEGDATVFLGDLAFMSPNPPESYLRRLHGSIFFLEGNHDPYSPTMSHCLLMRYKGVPYLFIHNPEELVKPFDGWVIHGHVHNKELANYPFFNPDKRTVNVSAEMIGYRPISLDEIHSLVAGTDEVILFRDLSQADEMVRDDPVVANCRFPEKGYDAGKARVFLHS